MLLGIDTAFDATCWAMSSKSLVFVTVLFDCALNQSMTPAVERLYSECRLLTLSMANKRLNRAFKLIWLIILTLHGSVLRAQRLGKALDRLCLLTCSFLAWILCFLRRMNQHVELNGYCMLLQYLFAQWL